MSDSERFELGSQVVCSDGSCGAVRRVVIDPATGVVTHLAVAPRHDHGTGRLVPVDLVASAGDEIELGCSMTEFEALLPAQDSELLPAGASQALAYQQDQMMGSVYSGLAVVPGQVLSPGQGQGTKTRTFDRVPDGEVDVRRGDQVEAIDGAIGRVRGLVVDPADHHVTHVLLEEGHPWGKKEVAIPIGSVERVDHGVRVNLTKEQVRELPPVDLEMLADPGA
jgi:sporulation protein YlmC with PRC-barrel domain